MGVEDVVRGLGVQNSGAELGIVYLHHVPEVAADVAQQVLNLGVVLSWGGGQDVGALHRLNAGTADEVVYLASANGWGVHPAKQVQGLVALFLTLDICQQTVIAQVAHRGYSHAFHGHGSGHSPPKVHAREHILTRGVDGLNQPSQPALNAQDFRLAGGPDVH